MRILHLFNWRIIDIVEHLDKISSSDWDAIIIPPLQPLTEESFYYGWPWCQCYLPTDFKIGNVFGTKEELELLCNEAEKRKIKIFADAVLNHTAGRSSAEPLIPHEKVADYLKNNPYFWKEKKEITNWNDRYQVINYCMNLPGLKTDNYELQDIMKTFLNEYINCGIQGFRLDAFKSFGLPSEGNHFCLRVVNGLKEQYPDIVFMGEFLNPNSLQLLKETTEYMKIITENACGLSLDDFVLFEESHDNFLTDNKDMSTSHKSEQQIINGYLNKINIPNVMFYPRYGIESVTNPELKKANQLIKKR